MSSQFDDSHENRQSGVQDDQTEHSIYEKLARARRSYKLAQVSLNLQDRLGLAKIRYEQRYLKPSSDNETVLSESSQNAAAAAAALNPEPESKTKTTPPADAAAGATVIVPKSFSSPMITDTFSDPFYYQQSTKYAPILHSDSLQEMEAAAAAAAAAVAGPHGVSEGRRRGPFLYSDPFRHSREAPMPNPWTHKWAFSVSQHMASLPSFSSPTDHHRYMRRHQTYPGGVGVGAGVGGGGRRWTYDHTDGIRERDTAVLQKHDPMLPSVPAFGVEDARRRPSSNSMDLHCSSSMSPRTPPPKRQRTAPIAPGKRSATTAAAAAAAAAAGENGADLLLYLANSPQGSFTSSAGYPYSKQHTHGHAPYMHSFNAATANATYHPYASSMHGLSSMSSDIPSTPPSRHNTTTTTIAAGYAPSSSLFSTPLPSSTIPTTPLSRLTNNCGGSYVNNSTTPFNFADYVNVTPSPAQPQTQTQKGTERGGQGQGQGQPPPSIPHQHTLSIRTARFRAPGASPAAEDADADADADEETTPSKKCRRKKNVLTPGPPLPMNRRDAKMPAKQEQDGAELMRVGGSLDDSDGTIADGEGGDDSVAAAVA